MNKIDMPLVVDLDGTLVRTDLLAETFIRSIFLRPWVIFVLPYWLLRGIPFVKRKLYQIAQIDIEYLPYNEELVEYLRGEYKRGRALHLCTGSWKELAEKIGEKFGIFTTISGSDENTNLTGSEKAKYLVAKFGSKCFAYAGNEKKDLEIWKHSSSCIVVHRSRALVEQAEKHCSVDKFFLHKNNSLASILRQIRVHQWVKNLLIFVPLLSSHLILESEHFLNASLAFIAYCFCASATYIINDLADIESDRRHAEKRKRPLAGANLSIPIALILAALLMLVSIVIAGTVSSLFVLSLCAYTFITLAYSFRLKRLQTLDIMVLASLYTLRIIAGSIAIAVVPSFWLLSFSMFIFFCLASVKRISEIIKNKDEYKNAEKLRGRGYYVTDYQALLTLSAASGMIAVLVIAMYINSVEVVQLYSEPYLLWLICPLLGYWVVRVIIMTARGEIDEDPIVFAIRDTRSLLTGGIIVIIMVAASILEIDIL